MKNFNLIDIICCPNCKQTLEEKEHKLFCSNCNTKFDKFNRYVNLLPSISKENKYEMNYIEHYKNDAEVFDYFEPRDFPATIHDELRVKQYVLSQITDSNNLILDVGSGSSWVAKNLSEDNIVVSMDIAENNIKKALEKFTSPNHFGTIADALNPPFKNYTFDYIIASEVIEHIVKPNEFISQLSKLLKNGGKLIITTPYKEKIQYYQCIHCNRLTPKNAHLHSFDENILSSYANNEITVEKFRIFGNKALLIIRTHILLKYFPFSLWKIIDKIANIIVPKINHVLIVYKKYEK